MFTIFFISAQLFCPFLGSFILWPVLIIVYLFYLLFSRGQKYVITATVNILQVNVKHLYKNVTLFIATKILYLKFFVKQNTCIKKEKQAQFGLLNKC